ncbi:MAG: SDR family oxidoreductase [Chloroflexota bacterium]
MADMTGKTAIITGATNGLGEVTALEIARMGAKTIIISRNEEKCKATVANIKADTGNSDVHYFVADLSLMADVRRVANEVKTFIDRLDVLVNNAGAWFTSYGETSEGIEQTWALNHLNYFLLTNLLLDDLKATASAHGEARVVSMSSGAHHEGEMHWDNLQFDGWKGHMGSYGPGWAVYSQSKLANVLFAFKLARLLDGTGVTSNAVHPGVVVTGFSQNNGWFFEMGAFFRRMFNKTTAHDGAEPQIYLATASEVQGVTGVYYGPPRKQEEVKPLAADTDAQDRLWHLSEEMVGLAQPV